MGLKEKLRSLPFRKIGKAIAILFLAGALFVGGYFAVSWYFWMEQSSPVERLYGEQAVYKSASYGFGVRYPESWQVTEVKPRIILFSPGEEEGKTPRDYISLVVSSNKGRPKTACEKKLSKCSFYAGGIVGEKSTSPEEEIVSFAYGDKDFTITLHKYSSSLEKVAQYQAIFEELAESFRFTSEVTAFCEATEDCALGIRLDRCCSCAEAYSQDEIKRNRLLSLFDPIKDYSQERFLDCSSESCSSCRPPGEVACGSNRCRLVEPSPPDY
jgi:hypothetical protein